MARPRGIWTPEVVRKRIQATKLMERLSDHVLGEVDMKPTQVQAALGLLKKVVPDMLQSSVTVSHVKRKSYGDRIRSESAATAPRPAAEALEHTVQ